MLGTHRGWGGPSHFLLESRWDQTERASCRWRCWPPGPPSTGMWGLRTCSRLRRTAGHCTATAGTYMIRSWEDIAGGPWESPAGSWYSELLWWDAGCIEHAHWEIVWEEQEGSWLTSTKFVDNSPTLPHESVLSGDGVEITLLPIVDEGVRFPYFSQHLYWQSQSILANY